MVRTSTHSFWKKQRGSERTCVLVTIAAIPHNSDIILLRLKEEASIGKDKDYVQNLLCHVFREYSCCYVMFYSGG